MSTAKRVIKNTFYLYAKMGITMFISLYVTRLILNTLGASDFGIFNVVGGAIAMLGFLNAAMSSSTQRFMSYYEGKEDKEKQKYIFNVSTVLHFGIAIFLGLLLLVAGYFFFNGILNIPVDRVNAAKVIYGCLILSTMFTVMSVPYEAVLNAHENMLYYSIVGVFESLLKLAVALIITRYAGDKLVFYGVLMAFIPFIIRAIMQVYCHRKYEECVLAPRRYWEKDLMKEMTSFASWGFLKTASRIASMQGMSIVLNFFYGVLLNASHGIASQINGQLMVLSNSMLKALNPVIVKNEGAQNRDAMLMASLIGNKISFLLFSFVSTPFIVEIDFILGVWLKNIPEYATVFCRFVIIITAMKQLTITFPVSVGAIGRIKELSIAEAAIILAFIPVSCLGYLIYDKEQLIYCVLIFVEFIVGGTRLFYAVKICGVKFADFLRIVLFPASSVYVLNMMLVFFISSCMSDNIFSFVVVLISHGMSFAILTYLIAFSGTEKEQIFAIINSGLKRAG